MATHISVRLGAKSKSRNGGEHSNDDNREPDGWAKHREPLPEKHISSLTAGAGHDKWAQRAEEHSGPAFAPGIGVKKSSQ